MSKTAYLAEAAATVGACLREIPALGMHVVAVRPRALDAIATVGSQGPRRGHADGCFTPARRLQTENNDWRNHTNSPCGLLGRQGLAFLKLLGLSIGALSAPAHPQNTVDISFSLYQ